MAITTYAEVLTAVQNWAGRTDSNFVARIPEFITLTESLLTWGSEDPEFPIPRLRCRQMEARDEAEIDAEYENITNWVSDFLEMRQIKLNTDPVTYLHYVTPQEFDQRYISSTTQKPEAFTIVGSQIRFGPTPDTAYDAELFYYQKIPALTSSNTTNWLLTAAPDIYLYGCLFHAVPYVRAAGIAVDSPIVENTAYWYRQLASRVNGLNTSDSMSRYGGTLKMRPGISVV